MARNVLARRPVAGVVSRSAGRHSRHRGGLTQGEFPGTSRCLNRLVGTLLLAALLTGCGWLPRVNWCHPGPAPYQQARARQFDPYPENDLGPPVVGGRPLSFGKPRAEPTRARRQSNWFGWLRRGQY